MARPKNKECKPLDPGAKDYPAKLVAKALSCQTGYTKKLEQRVEGLQVHVKAVEAAQAEEARKAEEASKPKE